MTEAEHYVRMLNNRVSSQEAERAQKWLLEHPTEGHPVLLEYLQKRGAETKRIIQFLPSFNDPSAIPLLCQIIKEEHSYSVDAAISLGRYRDLAATECLFSFLKGSIIHKNAALVGLRSQKRDSSCPLIIDLLKDKDSDIRWQALKTADVLECLNKEILESISQDPSEDVQELLRVIRSKR